MVSNESFQSRPEVSINDDSIARSDSDVKPSKVKFSALRNPTRGETRAWLDGYAEQYGAIPEGEKAGSRGDQNIPQAVSDNGRTRQTVRAYLEAISTPDSLDGELEHRDSLRTISENETVLHPINPITGEQYIYHDITFSNKQFGKKIGKHAKDYGLNPSNEANREGLIRHIEDIIKNADERAYGNWRNQEYPVVFHIKAEDVVVESKYGSFVTLLKGGISNERVKNARKRKVQ